MRGISSDDLVVQLVRLIPEVKPFLEKEAEREGLRASEVTHWDQIELTPANFLSEVLTYPLFQSAMEAPEIDAEAEDFLKRCFEFIEALEEDPTGFLVTTAYFTFVEYFLESKEVLDRAFRFAWPKTRNEMLSMVKGWNVPMDPSWGDLE
ncbi:hypothetical protein [Streptomyces sp. ME18-1-4]|uniref:hypothetical protein n=1 Tax=Streptomyces sp. ME18-1-4 TaxID=3028685 RepID=UPI0029B8FE13|nr:hypothetical protein [Streptomyces sp. ME18-1-4]MDX3248194.1 hypothetical protein [Streptomyces sp. ME18-1-4]